MRNGANGDGNNWSPVGDKTPWWINLIVWAFKQGLILQGLSVALLITVVMVILGKIESPMLSAFERIGNGMENNQRVLENIQREAAWTRTINERIEYHLKRNEGGRK